MISRSYCLISNIFEPPLMALDPNREHVIGRDARADFFLPARQVSRRHAKITWSAEEQGFVIRDLFSRRGVVVNGKKTERCLLRDDDEITIDPYRLRFRIYEGDLSVLFELDEDNRPRDWRLAGRCRGAELLDLVSQIDVADLSAVLRVDGDSGSGSMLIVAGQVLAAEVGSHHGSKAAHQLLMAERCTFDLQASEARPAPGQTPIPIGQLLFEILARMGSDFVTTIDSTGIRETDVLQLEKRISAHAAEKSLRALARKGRALEDDVDRAQELQHALQRPMPQDERLAFERIARPAGVMRGTIDSASKLGPGLFRVFIAEPVATGGVDGPLRAMLIKAEYDLMDNAGFRGADVLNLLHRRLGQRPEKIRLTASCLELTADHSGRCSVIYASDGDPQLVVCHDGSATRPETSSVTELDDGLQLMTVLLALDRGDRLLLFSNAVARQRDPAGHELGIARLVASATRASRLELRAALPAMVADVDEFRQGGPQEGDLIMVGVELR